MLGYSKKETQFKKWHAFLLMGILVTATVLGILQRLQSDDIEPPKIDVILNEQTCTVSGGEWNSCGSACRHNPDVPCIEICVPLCECETDSQCPFGNSCGEYVDKTGVCVQN